MLIRDIGTAAARGEGLIAFPGRRILRDLEGMPETLARAGDLELKFAVTKKEIRAVQKMRYRIFFKNGGAVADALSRAHKRDICPFDRICDHIIVVDHGFVTRGGRRKPRVAGAYRVLRDDRARGASHFYSAGEFDVARMIARHPGKRFLELGRSCVLPEYRARRVLELLWRGLWRYVRHHRIDVLFGCASLPGADASAHRDALAFLRAHAGAGEEWSAPATAPEANLVACGAAPDARSARRAMLALPPLIKGYLRVGACFGHDVFVDRAFGATDVFVVLPVDRIDPRYIEHLGGGALDEAA